MKPWQNCIDCAAFDKETGCCMKYATYIPDPSGGALASEDCFCEERPRYTLHVLVKGHEVRESKTGKVVYHFPSETFTPWENSERAALGTVEALNKAAESERRAALWKRAAKIYRNEKKQAKDELQHKERQFADTVNELVDVRHRAWRWKRAAKKYMEAIQEQEADRQMLVNASLWARAWKERAKNYKNESNVNLETARDFARYYEKACKELNAHGLLQDFLDRLEKEEGGEE